MKATITEDRIFDACRTLFGSDVRLSRDFLQYLQPDGAKSEYRRRAKQVHPDRHEAEDPEIQRRQAELFRELVAAHEVIAEFLGQRDSGQWRQASSPGPAVKTATRKKDRSAGARPKTQAKGGGGAQNGQPRQRSSEEWFYQGSVPSRYLEIGLYLFCRRRISFADLASALLWQRRQRPVLGDIARRWGWLDQGTVRQILGGSRPGRFGERAVGLGLLTLFQVQTLLFHQRSRQQRLGSYFVSQGWVSHAEMEQLAAELTRHNARMLARERRWPRSA